MSEPAIEGARPGVTVGPTTEFSLFFRVKDGEGAELREALEDLQDHPGYRPGDYDMAIVTIHEARFVLFDDDTRLLFATSFDGSWDAYMDDFFTSGPTLSLFDAIFSHIEGYDGLPDVDALHALRPRREQAPRRRMPGTTAARSRRFGRRSGSTTLSSRCSIVRPLPTALEHPALKPLLDEAAD